jgi:hypothetical protein
MTHNPTIADPIEPPNAPALQLLLQKVAQCLLRPLDERLVLPRSFLEIFQRLPHLFAAYNCAQQGFVEEVRRASGH